MIMIIIIIIIIIIIEVVVEDLYCAFYKEGLLKYALQTTYIINN